MMSPFTGQVYTVATLLVGVGAGVATALAEALGAGVSLALGEALGMAGFTGETEGAAALALGLTLGAALGVGVTVTCAVPATGAAGSLPFREEKR